MGGRRASFQAHEHNPAIHVSSSPAWSGSQPDGVPAQVGRYNWSFDRPGHTYTHYVQGSRFGDSPARGLDSKVSIWAGWSSQRSESETKPHMASHTASHLRRPTSYSRNRLGLFSSIKVLRASEGDAHECDCKSGQEPGDRARGGVAAWHPHLLDHSGPLGAAEPGASQARMGPPPCHRFSATSWVCGTDWLVSLGWIIYPHRCLPVGFGFLCQRS